MVCTKCGIVGADVSPDWPGPNGENKKTDRQKSRYLPRIYRERYAEWGLREARPYPGVMDALKRRFADGTRLILCTSKPAFFARQVVSYFGFAALLGDVYGPELDGRFDDKGDLIGHLMTTEQLHPADVCMVGDRKHDVQAALRHGVPTVEVLWGYGSRDELERAGAAVIIDRPGDLAP
jgi:phosphoglycolate phosphatase